MRDLSDVRKKQLVTVAGFLYALSLHKYVSRDPLSLQTGIQGVVEFALESGAFVCVFIAARHSRRLHAASSAILCFAAYGIFALASSWRSFNPPLSLTKALLLFVVLAMGYLASQVGLETRLFQSIYWSYTASLAVGLVLGAALPARFPLWSIDDFTGRTRLSVFGTFPGTMGETAAYLTLLAPLLFRNSHWVSRLFLLAMNVLAGGKLSTVILVFLLAVEYCSHIRSARSWRAVALVGGSCIAVCVGLYVMQVRGVDLSRWLSRSSEMVYGHDVEAEAVSLDGRLDLWRGGLTMLIENPVLGYGFDGARHALLRIAAWSGQSHNGILELGLAGGALSAGIFVLGLAGVFRACMRAAPDVRRKTLPVLAFMIVISFEGITFNFPSYLGLLVLTLLLYRSVQSIEQSLLSAMTLTPSSGSNTHGEPCRA
jgi:O-antigen ligase